MEILGREIKLPKRLRSGLLLILKTKSDELRAITKKQVADGKVRKALIRDDVKSELQRRWIVMKQYFLFMKIELWQRSLLLKNSELLFQFFSLFLNCELCFSRTLNSKVRVDQRARPHDEPVRTASHRGEDCGGETEPVLGGK